MSLVKRVSAKFEGSKAALSLSGVILIALAGVAVPAQAAFKTITTCNPAVAVSSGGPSSMHRGTTSSQAI